MSKYKIAWLPGDGVGPELADLATGRRSGMGQGSASTNNLYCGGDTYPATPAQTNITEEWTFAHAFKKVTTG